MDWNEGKKPLPSPKDSSVTVLVIGVSVCLAIICGCLWALAS